MLLLKQELHMYTHSLMARQNLVRDMHAWPLHGSAASDTVLLIGRMHSDASGLQDTGLPEYALLCIDRAISGEPLWHTVYDQPEKVSTQKQAPVAATYLTVRQPEL